jgi:hypothetical protein
LRFRLSLSFFLSPSHYLSSSLSINSPDRRDEAARERVVGEAQQEAGLADALFDFFRCQQVNPAALVIGPKIAPSRAFWTLYPSCRATHSDISDCFID